MVIGHGDVISKCESGRQKENQICSIHILLHLVCVKFDILKLNFVLWSRLRLSPDPVSSVMNSIWTLFLFETFVRVLLTRFVVTNRKMETLGFLKDYSIFHFNSRWLPQPPTSLSRANERSQRPGHHYKHSSFVVESVPHLLQSKRLFYSLSFDNFLSRTFSLHKLFDI